MFMVNATWNAKIKSRFVYRFHTFFCAYPYTWVSRGAFQAQVSVDQYCTFLFCMQALGPLSQWNLMTSSYINVLHSQRLLGCMYQ